MTASLHRPAGSLATADLAVSLTAADAGWSFAGLIVLSLAPGVERSIDLGENEGVVLPLSAIDVDVTIDGEEFRLDGRTSVFDRVTDFGYAPLGAKIDLNAAAGGEIAIATSRCERRLIPQYGSADNVAVELRGAGPATRQVNNFMSPEAWPGADKLMCVELITPDGNWSSYPPHRHDDSPECPVNNEEIYYFRIGLAGTSDYSAEGFGMHRTYTPDGSIDVNVVIHDGDVFCVPRGYHGPCIAAPGYPMYYLNVLAGPGGERSMAFCDDPTHHWVRDTWADMATDPRCPMTTKDGRTT
jgi:5-deoxy-glucuronate isomerase